MIKRKALVGLIVAATVAAFAFSSGLETKAAEGRRVVIEIRDFEFAPFAPDVKPGDVIVWINRDIVPHTATSDDGSWDSGQINPGGEWQMVVEDGLVESYFCRFHPSMTARLDITASR